MVQAYHLQRQKLPGIIMLKSIYTAFYVSLVIQFIRSMCRKILRPGRKFQNKHKFMLYAHPSGSDVILHIANLYVDEPSELEGTHLFEELNAVMDDFYIFARAGNGPHFTHWTEIQADKYQGRLSLSFENNMVIRTIDKIICKYVGDDNYDFFF